MSAPIWTPAKFSWVEFAQFTVTAEDPGAVTVAPFEMEVDLRSASPPTPRAQTPPPGWFGVGLGGAETNALPCWVKNTLLTLPMAPAIAAPEAPAGTASCWIFVTMNVPVCVWVQLAGVIFVWTWADAAEADSRTA